MLGQSQPDPLAQQDRQLALGKWIMGLLPSGPFGPAVPSPVVLGNPDPYYIDLEAMRHAAEAEAAEADSEPTWKARYLALEARVLRLQGLFREDT